MLLRKVLKKGVFPKPQMGWTPILPAYRFRSTAGGCLVSRLERWFDHRRVFLTKHWNICTCFFCLTVCRLMGDCGTDEYIYLVLVLVPPNKHVQSAFPSGKVWFTEQWQLGEHCILHGYLVLHQVVLAASTCCWCEVTAVAYVNTNNKKLLGRTLSGGVFIIILTCSPVCTASMKTVNFACSSEQT